MLSTVSKCFPGFNALTPFFSNHGSCVWKGRHYIQPMLSFLWAKNYNLHGKPLHGRFSSFSSISLLSELFFLNIMLYLLRISYMYNIFYLHAYCSHTSILYMFWGITLGYFTPQNIPYLATESSSIDCCCFDFFILTDIYTCVHVWLDCFEYFLAFRYSGLIYFFCHSPRMLYFPQKALWFKRDLRIQDLGTGCDWCWCGIIVSKASNNRVMEYLIY